MIVRQAHPRHVRARGTTAALVALFLMSVGAASVRAQLIITPTFGATINGDPNSAAIKATINAAIAEYAAKFSDPITVAIEFNEMGTGLGQSTTGYYKINYATFLPALKADASTSDDATANGTLPNSANNPINSTTTINVASANLRAIGLAGAAVVTGTTGGTFDGVIGLNTALMSTGIASGGLYSMRAVVQHEIDEVLGLGSGLPDTTGFFADPSPEDLFRYSGVGTRSHDPSNLSNVYFSIDGGVTNLAGFNNANNGGDYGDWDSSGGPRVQDAFGTPNANPTLGVELIALDVIGYNRISLATVPEPGPLVLASAASLAGLAGLARRRLLASAARPAR